MNSTVKDSKSRPPLKIEILAGLTTFLTTAYIVIVNPSILSVSGTGIPFSGALTATVLLCFVLTLMMGLYADLPFAVAPGMGINAFFTYSIILGQKVPWQQALGMVFWAGVIFLVISITPIRERLAKAIPHTLRIAASAGIGLFLTFIGLKNAGLVVADPVTFVKMGTFDSKVALSLIGMVASVFFMRKKNPLAFLIGIFTATFLAWALGLISVPRKFLSAPDFSGVFLKLDIFGALKWSLAPAIVSIMFTDLFDSISTFVGVAHATNLLDEKKEPKNLRQGLIVDAWATLLAGIFGTSSGTAYLESAAGIEVGGRTGRTAIVTALCFLPCFFIAPFVSMIPDFATAPVLIIVGALMFRSVQELKVTTLEDLFPSFLTIVLIPLTFSITQGILWGFLSHVILYVLAGKQREVKPMMYVLAACSTALLFVLNS